MTVGRSSTRVLWCLGAATGLATIFAFAGAVVVAPPASNAQSIAASAGPPGFAALVAKVKPAVVAVHVEKIARAQSAVEGEGRADQNPANAALRRVTEHATRGSGFFVSPDGYAVTNHHVVDGSISIHVTTSDGATYSASVVGTNSRTDLALLKVDAGHEVSYVNFADKLPKTGDWVLTIGSPFGFDGTVTAGIVSGRGRDIGIGPYENYLQIDAPINSGSSGSPAFDMRGRVIGVNTAIYSPCGGSVGVAFDIPATAAKFVLTEIRNHGRVVRGWIGVRVRAPDQLEATGGLNSQHVGGVTVDAARPGSPAANVGILPGDLIVAVDGAPIRDRADFGRRVEAKQPGSLITLRVSRNGQVKTLKLVLGQMPRTQVTGSGTPYQTAGGKPR